MEIFEVWFTVDGGEFFMFEEKIFHVRAYIVGYDVFLFFIASRVYYIKLLIWKYDTDGVLLIYWAIMWAGISLVLLVECVRAI